MAPPEVFIRRITDPHSPDVDAITKVKCVAGKDDPAAMAFCWGKDELAYPFWRAETTAQAVGGYLFAACWERNENIVGCIAFYPPGKEIMADEEQRSLGFDEFVSKLPEEQRELGMNQYVPAYHAMTDPILGAGVKLASYSINSYFVFPEYRGRGVGRALIEAGEALAKGEHVPVIVECEAHNKAMYEHFGYRVLGEGPVPVGAPKLDKVVFSVLRKDFPAEV